MKNLIGYKGYFGSVTFDPEDLIFYGKIEFIKALVSYEGENAREIKQAFEEAVDDYLEMCATEGLIPETSFKGSLNIRIGENLHRKAAIVAQYKDVSLNKFIIDALEKACEELEPDAIGVTKHQPNKNKKNT